MPGTLPRPHITGTQSGDRGVGGYTRVRGLTWRSAGAREIAAVDQTSWSL